MLMKPVLPSNRQFGLVFVVFFAVLAAVSWWRGGNWYPGLALASLSVGLIALAAPTLLTPFNRWWMKLAEIMNRVVSPVVLGVMFFGLITPYGLVMRVFRADPLRRKAEPDATSYWIDRDPPGPAVGSMNNQF